jgi:hypothetical protein
MIVFILLNGFLIGAVMEGREFAAKIEIAKCGLFIVACFVWLPLSTLYICAMVVSLASLVLLLNQQFEIIHLREMPYQSD